MHRCPAFVLIAGSLLVGLPADLSGLQDTVIAPADADVIPDNPFADVETHFLSNGVKIWYRYLPGAPDVSISVSVPFGSDHDPEGREELAHFTEHMLFSDHRGLTEQEIKDQIESRGGRRNALTAPDRTWYYVTIGKEHGLFALEWLSRILEPHAMDSAVVDRNREPVANEIGVRPREPAEELLALLDPEWLRMPGFWEREFGLEVRSARRYDRWASLQAITVQDLQEFYETHYAPSGLTVTMVGDLPREEVLELAQRTFGSLLPRSPEVESRTLEDPGRRRESQRWSVRSNVIYDRRFKFFRPTADELLHAQFVADYLGRRLADRLRFGERKAVYGINTGLRRRGPAAYLQIRGTIDEEDYDFARGVIEEEIERLRTASLSAEEFDADRTTLVERLRAGTNTAEDLNSWTYRLFYQPEVFRDFPDLVGFYEDLTREELSRFATDHLVPEREVVRIVHVLPVAVTSLIAAGLVLLWVTFRITGWALIRRVDLREIIYLARFRVPVILAALRFLAFAAVTVVAFRLLLFGFEWISVRWVEPLDVFFYQAGAYAAMATISFVLLLLCLSRIPRKLLVFPDHLRVKALSFRSRLLKPGEIAEIARRRGPGVYFGKELFRTSILTFGLLRPGIHLKTHEGRSLFFRSRKTDELLAVLQEWRGGSGTDPGAAADTPDPDPPDDSPPDEPPPDDDIDIDSLEIDDPELEALLRSNP